MKSNIFNKFIGRMGDALKAFSGIGGSLPFSIAGFTGRLRTRSSEQDPLGNYAGFVYAAISKRAKRVGAINLHLYELDRNQDVEEVWDHDLLSLIGRANPFQTKYQLFYTIEMMLGIWGSAPVYKDRMGGKSIQYLWPLRPDWLKAITNSEGIVVSYEYRAGSKVSKFPKDDVILINEPNPASVATGFSPVSAASLEIDSDVQAAMWNKFLIENFAEPGGTLTTDQSLNDTQFERVKTQWAQRQQGAVNAGRWAVLEKGLKAEVIGRSPQEMQLLDSRKFNRNAIASILGVPMALLASEDVNLANIEGAERVFAKDTVEPQMKLIVGAFNEDLVMEFGDNLELDNDSPVPEDVKQKVETATAGEGRWLTVNEARDMFGYAPLEGGDAIFKPLGVMPQVGEGVKGAKGPISGYERIIVGKGGHTSEMKRRNRIKQSILARTRFKRKYGEGVAEKVAAKISKAVGESQTVKIAGVRVVEKGHQHDAGCKVHGNRVSIKTDEDTSDLDPRLVAERKSYLKKLPRHQKAFETQLQGYFKKQEKEVLENLKENGIPKGRGNHAPAVKSLDKWVNKIIFDSKSNDDALVQMTGAVYRENIVTGAEAIASLLGIDASDVLATPFVVDFIRDESFKLLSVNQTTQKELRKTLLEGVAEGEGIDEIRERITDVYDDAQDFRAETIARTEVGAAQNFGRNAEMINQGVKKKRWLAIFNNSRDSHMAASEQVVNVDESFEVGGEMLEYPGDPAGSPENVINCQCSVSPTLGD